MGAWVAPNDVLGTLINQIYSGADNTHLNLEVRIFNADFLEAEPLRCRFGALVPNPPQVPSSGKTPQAPIAIDPWNADTGELLKELRARGAPVLTVSWHPDGQTLLAADGDATLWDVTNGHILQTYECQLGSHPNAYISDAMFSPDGSFVAGVADNQFVCIWDTSSGRLLNTILLEADVYKVVWNPVEMQIAIIQSEELYASTRRVSLWDPLTGEAFSVIDGQPDAQSLAWSPDGTRLATGGRDGAIHVWGFT